MGPLPLPTLVLVASVVRVVVTSQIYATTSIPQTEALAILPPVALPKPDATPFRARPKG